LLAALHTAVITLDIAGLRPPRGVRLVATDRPFSAGARGHQLSTASKAACLRVLRENGIIEQSADAGGTKAGVA
jgi:hypothetical protein